MAAATVIAAGWTGLDDGSDALDPLVELEGEPGVDNGPKSRRFAPTTTLIAIAIAAARPASAPRWPEGPAP